MEEPLNIPYPAATGHNHENSEVLDLQSKQDIMNMSIEMVWKEMEELNRSKQAAHHLFEEF